MTKPQFSPLTIELILVFVNELEMLQSEVYINFYLWLFTYYMFS